MFAKNRQRLLDADVAREFLLQIVEQARKQRLLSVVTQFEMGYQEIG